jgi:hypothetical protein
MLTPKHRGLLWFSVPLVLAVLVGLAIMSDDSADHEMAQPHRRVAGLDAYTDPLPGGEKVTLDTARKFTPLPLALPEIPGVAEDSLVVEVWMNDREIYVEYPKGLFVSFAVPDAGAGPPNEAADAEFEAAGGSVTNVGDAIELFLDTARVSIVSLEGAYSEEDLSKIAAEIEQKI